MIIGIDASNLKSGGSITHLKYVLRNVKFTHEKISKIVIWGGEVPVSYIKDDPLIEVVKLKFWDRNSLTRFVWKNILLAFRARNSCDILYVPGGIYLGTFRPFISMFRNILPFHEIKFNLSDGRYFRYKILKILLLITFRNSSGIIFISEASREFLNGKFPFLRSKSQKIVHHGVDHEFWQKREDSVGGEVVNIIYVSTIDYHKNHIHVIDALQSLIHSGYKIRLHLVGNSFDKCYRKYLPVEANIDPESVFIKRYDFISQDKINELYDCSDFFLYASSAETFGQVLLEAMAKKLSIICSDIPTNRELVGDHAFYFDEKSTESISNAVRKALNEEKKRKSFIDKAYKRSLHYSWRKCAEETFSFIVRHNE